MEPLTPGRVTSRAGSPSLSHRAFPPFCPQPPHGAPSSLLCSPQLCQRDGLPVPFQIPAFLMPLGVRQVWASHTPSRLAAPCSRNGFVILRTGGSPSVALHPALRQRSYFRFRVGGAYPEGTCTPLTLRLGGALGAGHARDCKATVCQQHGRFCSYPRSSVGTPPRTLHRMVMVKDASRRAYTPPKTMARSPKDWPVLGGCGPLPTTALLGKPPAAVYFFRNRYGSARVSQGLSGYSAASRS